MVRVEGGTNYVLKNGVSLTNITGNVWDMVEYKGYLIISSSNSSIGGVLSCYGITTSTAFFQSFKTGLTNGYYLKMLIGQDDILYICNGNNIASVSSFVVGSFSVAPTCTLNSSALDLPEGNYAVTMAELGKFLMIGTQGGGSWSAIGNQRVANIYPWDRVSASFSLPIIVNEDGIHAMVSNNNRLYFVAGTLGNVYEADGTTYRKIRRIPWFTENRNSLIWVYPNALSINQNNNLLIGLSVYSGNASNIGVYEMSTDEDAVCNLKYLPSTVSTSNSIGSVTPLYTDKVYIGWQSASTFGLDETFAYVPYSSYGTVIQSALFIVGSNLLKKTFEHIQFLLGKPLTGGQGIRVSYRKNLTDAWTTTNTWTYTSLGSRISFEDKISISDAEVVQIQIEIDQNAQASPTPLWGVDLIAVRIW